MIDTLPAVDPLGTSPQPSPRIPATAIHASTNARAAALHWLLGALLVGGASAGGSCRPADDAFDDPRPLPARVFSDAPGMLQPVKLSVEKKVRAEEKIEIVPPAGGDPRVRAVVLGQAPLRQALEQLDDGRLQVGQIIVDTEKGMMIMPGRINQTSGIIEYMAVGPRGKLHESVLMLDVHPLHLQVACILLGLKATPLPERQSPDQAGRKGQKTADLATPTRIGEARVTLEVSWLVDGKVVTHRAEELAYNREQKKTMDKGSWLYTGSLIYRGVFTAEFDQSLIATWPDRSALINTLQEARNPYRGDDLGFEANEPLLPPKGTPIRLTLRRVQQGSRPPVLDAAVPPATFAVTPGTALDSPPNPSTPPSLPRAPASASRGPETR